MRRVRSMDTSPERTVRSLLHRMGFRFRLYPGKLPGNPDIVLPKYVTVVFVHGCFWHRHPGCSRATTPSTNQEYWLPKFRRTIERDKRTHEELHALGWNVVIVWECELKDIAMLKNKLFSALTLAKPGHYPHGFPLMLAAEERMTYEMGSKEGQEGKVKTKIDSG